MPIPSDAPERSAGVERTGVASSRKTRQRRSTPATPTAPSFTAEIARLTKAREKLLADLSEVTEREKAGVTFPRLRLSLGARLRNVDMKIFAYRQFVFLFGDPI